MRVSMRVEPTTIENDRGDWISGVKVTCSRCGYYVKIYGDSDASIRRGALMLREECFYHERNYYFDEDETPPPLYSRPSPQLSPDPDNTRRTDMASFEEILNRPASEIKPPQAYPVGTYHCLVDGPPTPGKSSQKQTDYLQFKYKILSPMQDVNAQAAAEIQVAGKLITQDFYITDGAAWRLKEMLVDHLGIEEGSKSMKELIAEAGGKQLLVKLKHELSQDGKRVFHRVDSTARV